MAWMLRYGAPPQTLAEAQARLHFWIQNRVLRTGGCSSPASPSSEILEGRFFAGDPRALPASLGTSGSAPRWCAWRRPSVLAGKKGEEGLGRQLLDVNRKLWMVAGPSICTRFSTFGVTVISQAFVGHISATELAAYALVSTLLMRFSNGILVQQLRRHQPGQVGCC